MSNKTKEKFWQTSNRKLDYSERTLIMAILNVTPDSFSDGGKYNSIKNALKQTEKLISEGADILDIGGESTRPNSERVNIEEEIKRTAPVIEEIKKRFDIPISIDTSKSKVAEKAVAAGAEIINDVSGLKFDERIGAVAAKYKTGLVLMHLRGEFESMHKQKPVQNILQEVSKGFQMSIDKAKSFCVKDKQICLDIGIGFGKTLEQNLELLAKLQSLCGDFSNYPMLVGTSRKSFIGRVLNNIPVDKRLNGTVATNAIAVFNGANVIRVHDVKENAEAVRIAEEVLKQK